jgi:short-subunit dehydrogenase
MNLRNARVLVTGAAGGIGSATVRELVRAGAAVVLADLRREPLERLAAQLGPACVGIAAADISTDAGRALLLDAAREHRVSVLVNAAGINPFGLIEQQTSAEIARALSINAVAPILLCHALLPVLRSAPSAHIVNVGSTFGAIGFPGFTAYSASKFAVRGFSEALRRELADSPIRVHYVAPRATRTALATDRVRAMNEELKVGMDAPEDVARAIREVLERERPERYLGGPERLFARLNALLPRLVDRSLLRQLPVIRRHAAAEPAPRAAAPSPIPHNV